MFEGHLDSGAGTWLCYGDLMGRQDTSDRSWYLTCDMTVASTGTSGYVNPDSEQVIFAHDMGDFPFDYNAEAFWWNMTDNPSFYTFDTTTAHTIVLTLNCGAANCPNETDLERATMEIRLPWDE